MKGTVTACLAAMVEEKFGGASRWNEIVRDAAVAPSVVPMLTLPTADVDDGVFQALLASACKVLGCPIQQLADAFGEYWCCAYAPRQYRPIFNRIASAREMLLALDDIHVRMTAMIADARPPRFEFHWVSDDCLEIVYVSKRHLVELVVGLARGVGKYFGELLRVTRVAPDRVRIDFGQKRATQV
jgi:hypothetical protein